MELQQFAAGYALDIPESPHIRTIEQRFGVFAFESTDHVG